MTNSNSPFVLLVEDCDDDAFFFERTLQKAGVTCSMRHATDGAQAVDFLRDACSEFQLLPVAIFLDLKMPVLNGFEVLDWLRTQRFPPEIPVIVLSGSEHQADKERAAQLGATDYIVKPVKVTDIHKYLRDVCHPEMGARV